MIKIFYQGYDLKNLLKAFREKVFLGNIKKLKGIDTLIYAFMGLGINYIQKEKIKLIVSSPKIVLEKLKDSQTEAVSHLYFDWNREICSKILLAQSDVET